jgi:hypothetical protein
MTGRANSAAVARRESRGDVVSEGGLSPYLRERILAEAAPL